LQNEQCKILVLAEPFFSDITIHYQLYQALF
jgi:hypothetical protein